MYIPDERLSWLRLLFKWRGSVLARVWLRILFVTSIAVVNTAVREYSDYLHFSLTPSPFILIGLPLGVFLGFRNGASYDRFWEGRRLWGALVNTSRTLTRQILTLTDPDQKAFHREMVRRIIAYAWALRFHLRDEADDGVVGRYLPPGEREAYAGERNLPIALVQRMGERVSDAWRAGWIHVEHVPTFDASLTAFCDIQGACERIKSTPIPFSYSVLIHRIVAIYCFLLPFGFAETIHWLTPLVVLFISYAFFGLDQIGDEIEDPFGVDVNDLPLGAMARNIEINLMQRLGETPLPEPMQPVDGVLL